jgi:hypothetical protein
MYKCIWMMWWCDDRGCYEQEQDKLNQNTGHNKAQNSIKIICKMSHSI